jgi:hypothetical protein
LMVGGDDLQVGVIGKGNRLLCGEVVGHGFHGLFGVCFVSA